MLPGSLIHAVSVIIPTHNRKSRLRCTLTSVLEQTLQPLEVIVVDDGSTDGTLDLLVTEFPSIIVITQTNHGVSHARNQGIKQAQGQWIALLDSDDTWHPTKLENQHKFLKRNPSLCFCHTDEVWVRHGKQIKKPAYLNKSNQDIFLKSLVRCIICPSSVVMHKKIFENIGFFDEQLTVCEDYDIWLRALLQYEISYLDQPLVTKYGGHSDQLSTTYWGMDRFRIQSLKNLLSNPNLKSNQIPLILETLIQKLDILAKSFTKREKMKEAEEFIKSRQFYSDMLIRHTQSIHH